MKRWLSILFFLGLILLKPISQIGWEVWYEVNEEYVAAELCENQDEPELECNGKCYLMKQLKKSEPAPTQNEEDRAINPFSLKIELFQNCTQMDLVHEEFNIERGHDIFFYSNSYAKDISPNIFHPPINCV